MCIHIYAYTSADRFTHTSADLSAAISADITADTSADISAYIRLFVRGSRWLSKGVGGRPKFLPLGPCWTLPLGSTKAPPLGPCWGLPYRAKRGMLGAKCKLHITQPLDCT